MSAQRQDRPFKTFDKLLATDRVRALLSARFRNEQDVRPASADRGPLDDRRDRVAAARRALENGGQDASRTTQ